jgi:hypothetical protein
MRAVPGMRDSLKSNGSMSTRRQCPLMTPSGENPSQTRPDFKDQSLLNARADKQMFEKIMT